jgi:hypothetical protein
MASQKTRGKEDTVQVAFMLPRALVHQIKVEAAKRGVFPAHYVRDTMKRDLGKASPAA